MINKSALSSTFLPPAIAFDSAPCTSIYPARGDLMSAMNELNVMPGTSIVLQRVATPSTMR
ncbi:hypothetical protein CQW49_18020 [Methylosinus trichosporium OB3b]|uniref:Uncharacterized protein n=1 Tax=Methylosinus trichosporium (strain ATCC 35070 / NCIMB 11131 / UNIQEM 75 / OB3b) TaxID=595536 RepID=A0A2D2D3L3_METT3|nr:hypothetical protein CQW49_18020 [Methylosinus trichosporium OB3b]OBS50474.1 hypothetical protein A8B73_21170 [Methylosinus sp. 3S-1]